jgi:hypothetical protein
LNAFEKKGKKEAWAEIRVSSFKLGVSSFEQMLERWKGLSLGSRLDHRNLTIPETLKPEA